MAIFDRSAFLDRLSRIAGQPLVDWSKKLAWAHQQKLHSINPDVQARWQRLLEQLPSRKHGHWDATGDTIEISGTLPPALADSVEPLEHQMLRLSPWRVGPYRIFGIDVDAEWRSYKKWDRIKSSVYFDQANVLDVGCNNGYFGFKAVAAGAKIVVGCDPVLLYNMQHEIFRQYAPDEDRQAVFPIADSEIPHGLHCFDVVLSMGVLYHRTSPIDHLDLLRSSLRKRGQLVLETLAIDSHAADVLVPEGRFAKMRGVWFIPTIGMLKRWLQRTGFEDINLIDVSTTTSLEQRRTRFMPFESLEDFLDPHDPAKTIEGHPTPARVVLSAIRRH